MASLAEVYLNHSIMQILYHREMKTHATGHM